VTRLLRAGWGGALLIAPDRLLSLFGGERSAPVIMAMRVLGFRHVLEAVVMVAEDDPRPPRWMIAIDLVHAVSMVGVAASWPSVRRDALLSAASALSLVGLSLRRGGSSHGEPPL
jgi:hypothetical protein